MNVEAAIEEPQSTRPIPWAVWPLLVIAGLVAVRSFTHGTVVPLATLTVLEPVLLATAVIFATPRDKRLVIATLALAAPAAFSVIGSWVPDAWYTIMPGDLKNAANFLADVAGFVREFGTIAGLVGLGLLGFALGGVRTWMSAVILAFGLFVGSSNVLWMSASGIEMPPIDLIQNIGYSVFYALGWAFIFAAALESLNTVAWVGSGLVFANVAISSALLWWQPDAGSAQTILFVTALPAVIGMGVLIYGALRGELAVPSRSPAGRGSSSRQRAG